MSTVRFAELCDECGRRSPEYSRWNVCVECGMDVCTDCDMESQRDEEHARTLCRECFNEVAA